MSAPTLVVAPFTVAFNEWLPRGRSAIGDGLASLLITELSRMGRFDLLESSALPDLEAETQVGGRGMGGLAMPAANSQWAGADFVLYSKLMEAQHSAQTVGSAGPLVLPPIFRSNKHLTRVQIDWRLVQVANRKIVATGQAIGEEKGVSSGLAQGLGADFFQTAQFRDSAMGKAINKAIAAIASELDQVSLPPLARGTAIPANQLPTQTAESASPAVPPATGQVAATTGGGVVIVSLGAKHGIKVGDRLQLFERVDLKDESGQVIFTEEKAAGEVLLDAVNEDRSKGQYTGPSTPKVGWLVKKK
jgi:curli biogenesis system outer membrane secretion channel CsgG